MSANDARTGVTEAASTPASDELLALKQAFGQMAHKINNVLSPAALYVDSVLAREHQLGERSCEQLRSVQAAIEEVTQVLASLPRFDHPVAAAPGPDAADATASMVPAPDDPPGVPDPSGSLRILLVDDDPLLLASLSRTLGFDGHEVVCASGATEGIAQAEHASACGRLFGVVITDLSMQGMDGRALARHLKARGLAGHVIMLTGWGSDLEDDGHLPEHVDQLLSKPPRLSALRRALSRVAPPR